jgi:N6-adenosine-specific RNA methylase IME4
MADMAREAERRYRTIVADPPWPHPDSGARTHSNAGWWKNGNHDGRQCVVPYARMSLDQIARLPVASLAEHDAHLYLWTTNAFLRDGYRAVESWGFTPSTLLTWCKTPMGLGLGGAYTITTEFVIYARRGSLAPLRRWDSTWFNLKRYYENGSPAHSAKPDGFLDIVEQVSPGPYLELFARRARFGWDYWGDESLGTVELGAAS